MAEEYVKTKELKRLSRSELLELLLAQTKRADELEAHVAELEQKLADRNLLVAETGTLAEAAMKINQVFEAADAAARQYLENVRRIADGEQEHDEPRDDENEPVSE